MFGYVRVHKPELKVKEYELYRSTYCGLCRSMGKCTGQCSRMTLSYDFAFLAIMRVTLLRQEVSFGKKRCLAHPLQKKHYMENNPSLEYCSGAAALLNYHKIADDLADERGIKKLRAILVLPFVAHARKKALKSGLSALDAEIAKVKAEKDRADGLAQQLADAQAKLEETENAGKTEAERTAAANAKALKALQTQVVYESSYQL